MILSLIGIGCGNPEHLTLQAIAEINRADLILLPDKGQDKAALAHLRQQILERHLSNPKVQIRPFAMPERRRDAGYLQGVNDWHDQIAACWLAEIAAAGNPDRVALLVWGDPSLYDSTLRIAARLTPAPQIQVVPGITSLSMLTAAHAVALNGLAQSVAILPARVLRDQGWPANIASIAVFLDDGSTLAGLTENCQIWWGAYLGMPEQVLVAGPLGEVRTQIKTLRQNLRAQHGWIMDLYLLRQA